MFGMKSKGQAGIFGIILAIVVGVIGAVIISTLMMSSAWNSTIVGLNLTIGTYILTFFVLGLMALGAGMAMKAVNG